MDDKSQTQETSPVELEIIEPTPGSLMRKRIFGHAGLIVGVTVLGVIFLMAILAPIISPGAPFDQHCHKNSFHRFGMIIPKPVGSIRSGRTIWVEII